jgi:D-glycero-alpha-D-manno-heptose-7-phosphate kinase
MILSRAPTRITLGGGGTDLASYYSQYGGFVIAGAINRYCTILANKRFYNSIRLSYSQMEIKDKVEDIEHRIFRAALQTTDIRSGIELHSTSDVPSNSGLGTSSTFTVALLNALHAYKREYISQSQLAEEACDIEIGMLKEPIGKQDQYIATYGGLKCFTFEKDGNVVVEPLNVSPDVSEQLEDNLVLFFTGRERSASEILRDQDDKSKVGDTAMLNNLHRTKDIGLQTRKYLENGNIDMIGELFHEHWENKKVRSSVMSDQTIDESYDIARKNGALGGKLIGAGGGGFLMFYCVNGCKPKVINAVQKAGLRWERFHFDYDGAKILVNT